MKNNKFFFKLTVASIAMLLVFSLFATTTEAHAPTKSLEELLDESDSIIAGTVESVNSYWHDDYNSIYSSVVVWVDDIFKGEDEREKITIVIPGGEVDGLRQFVSDMPLFEPGERAVIFLDKTFDRSVPDWVTGNGTFSITGGFQGKLDIDDNNSINGFPLELFGEAFEAYESEGIQFNIEVYENSSTYQNNKDFVTIGIRWPGPSPSVPFVVNASDEITTQIRAAANTWSKAGANFGLTYKSGHTNTSKATFNGVNEIFRGDLGQHRALAVATIWFNGSQIVEADMTFNSAFTWSTTGSGGYDIQTVALHEFGHWVGLDHSPIWESIMYYQIKGVQRNLHPVDVAGIQYIYGKSASSGTDPINNPDPEAEDCIIKPPAKPSGPSEGYVGVNYSFSVAGATCSQGHPVEYRFHWDDDTNQTLSSWIATGKASKTWQSEGTYNVRVRARCSVDNSYFSDWSPILKVTISGEAPVTNPESNKDPEEDNTSSPDNGTDETTNDDPKDDNDGSGTDDQVKDDTDNTKNNDTDESEKTTVKHNLNIKIEGKGTVNPSAGKHQYEINSEVQLQATPAAGWAFEKWLLDDLELHSDSITVTVSKDREVTAYFTRLNLGDISGDGEVTVNDVVLAMRHILGQATLNSDKLLLADVNGDGEIDIRDVTLIMRYALGIIDTFPAH